MVPNPLKDYIQAVQLGTILIFSFKNNITAYQALCNLSAPSYV